MLWHHWHLLQGSPPPVDPRLYIAYVLCQQMPTDDGDLDGLGVIDNVGRMSDVDAGADGGLRPQVQQDGLVHRYARSLGLFGRQMVSSYREKAAIWSIDDISNSILK